MIQPQQKQTPSTQSLQPTHPANLKLKPTHPINQSFQPSQVITIARIKAGKYSFPSPYFDKVSEDAKGACAATERERERVCVCLDASQGKAYVVCLTCFESKAARTLPPPRRLSTNAPHDIPPNKQQTPSAACMLTPNHSPPPTPPHTPPTTTQT